VDRLADDLALRFAQSEKLALALAAAFESMSNEELSARYRAIEAGLAPWGLLVWPLVLARLFFSKPQSHKSR
jgi:hypothetical protein